MHPSRWPTRILDADGILTGAGKEKAGGLTLYDDASYSNREARAARS